MSETTPATPDQAAPDLRIIEITIRSNVPHVGKTLIASRLARVLRNEFRTPPVLIDNATGDVEQATSVLNQNGPPPLEDVRVIIIDDDGAPQSSSVNTVEQHRYYAGVPMLTGAVPDGTPQP